MNKKNIIIKLNLFIILAIFIFSFNIKIASASEISSQRLINYINLERRKQGLKSLDFNIDLYNAAVNKGLDMISRDYFEHNTPYGKPWHYFLIDNNYDYSFAGENLAMDFETSEGVHYALMNSPLHRDNIVNDRFQEVGVGVVKGEFAGKQTTMVVQLFGVRKINLESVRPMLKQAISSLQVWLSF